MTNQSQDGYEKFKSINDQVVSNKMTADAATKELSDVDFLLFDINQIELVQNATWLSDDFAVGILKSWMRQQDQLLLNLRAQLVFTPEITKERLIEFAEVMKLPSKPCNLVVENIINKISTAGGLRSPVNPIDLQHPENGLIGFEQSNALTNLTRNPLTNLFDFRNDTYYSSASVANVYLIIALPPFLKANLTAYTLRGPPKIVGQSAQGGPKSWNLHGSNDLEELHGGSCTLIDSQHDNNDLENADAQKTFNVRPTNYYRYFKLILTGNNHQNNNTITLSGFDLTGMLIICRE